jgi:hypothetical protein
LGDKHANFVGFIFDFLVSNAVNGAEDYAEEGPGDVRQVGAK